MLNVILAPSGSGKTHFIKHSPKNMRGVHVKNSGVMRSDGGFIFVDADYLIPVSCAYRNIGQAFGAIWWREPAHIAVLAEYMLEAARDIATSLEGISNVVLLTADKTIASRADCVSIFIPNMNAYSDNMRARLISGITGQPYLSGKEIEETIVDYRNFASQRRLNAFPRIGSAVAAVKKSVANSAQKSLRDLTFVR